MNRIAQRYAMALYELAQEENNITGYQKEMRFVKETYQQNPEFVDFMRHVIISKEDKKALLRRIFTDNISESAQRFLCLMVDRDRYRLIPEAIEEFDALCNESQGIVSGIVYSVRILDAQEIRNAEALAEATLHTKVELENQLDKTLISGIKIVVNGKVIDGSIKNRLDTLRAELLK